ncbi:MAG: phospholipase D-like domain-containing protein, partial [Bacteroidota bacterium]
DNTPHCFNINEVPVELYFSPTDGTANQIKATLEKAENELAFATLVFTDNGLGNTVRDAHDAGLDVKGIIDYVEFNGSEFNFLMNNGVNVIDYQNADGSQWPDGPTLHHKYAIVDYASGANPAVITGSHNWTASANSIHDENTLIIYDATLANVYFQEFNARFNALVSTTTIPDRPSLAVYPNPTTAALTIDVPEPGILSITNLQGQMIQQREVAVGQLQLSVAQLPAGIYFLQLNDYLAKIVRQ